MDSDSLAIDAKHAWQRGFDWLVQRQLPRGNWLGEMKCTTLFTTPYVIVSYLIGRPLTDVRRKRLIHYLQLQRTPEGAWGLHSESPPTVYNTTLAYVALRLLGLSPDDEVTRRALLWLKTAGGAIRNPTWGKFWLALVNLYGWEGVNPIQPEIWLLPRWWPAHPCQFYNHTRLVYLAMAYLYGRRFSAPLSPIIEALRNELYGGSYDQIDFAGNRSNISPTDLYAPPTWFLKHVYWLLLQLESHSPRRLRRRALEECFAQIVFEVRASNYVNLSPANGLLNILALWDRNHPDLDRTYDNIHYWYWEDDDQGMRSSSGADAHTWDTSFVVQAALAAPSSLRPTQLVESLRRAHTYLRSSQLTNEVTDERGRRRWARDSNLGGWCLSDERHAWPVSDCTAEALNAILELETLIPTAERIGKENLVAAADFVLSRQNADGGFGTFERRRGPKWLELFNPAEMFADCMIEGSHVECTGSCIAGLHRFRQCLPGIRQQEIIRAVNRGVRFLLAQQRSDGSWKGAWGINFTYGTLFAVSGLLAIGLPKEHPAIRRAGSWLLKHQMPEGGWGEHWTSLLTGQYRPHERPQVIMTAWALLTLLYIGNSEAQTAVDSGMRWLINRQLPNGDFPEESPGGAFLRTGALQYSLYKNYFSLWAIGLYLRTVGL